MKVKDGLEQEYEHFKRINGYYGDCFAIGYARNVIEFMEDWADEMEKRMRAKATVEEVAKDALCKACERNSISWAQYGFARENLFYFWEHGEELKQAKLAGQIE